MRIAIKRMVLLALLITLLGACGTDEPSATTGSPAGTLRVERIHDGGGPIGLEGSVSFARITDADGDVVLEEGFDAPNHEGQTSRYPETLRADLEPGSYTLFSYQRSCSGTCEALDPPAKDHECEARFDIEEGAEADATVVIERNSCSIKLGP